MRRYLGSIVAAILMTALILMYNFVGAADLFAQVDKDTSEIGVLVIAHGSREESWCRLIRQAVGEVNLPYPIELGFLEFVSGQTIHRAVERLNALGIRRIIAVPLFISSNSYHIQEIEYVLGIRDELLGTELTQAKTATEITLTKAMNDHPLVAHILADRIIELSREPEKETVVIVGHGKEEEKGFIGWKNCLTSLAERIRIILKCEMEPSIQPKDIKYCFIHVNEKKHPEFTLRSVVRKASHPIVIPLMVSEGSFTRRHIPQTLKNLAYAYDGKTLAPHSYVAKWIETKVRCAIGEERYGVLVIDHGARDPMRLKAIRETVKMVRMDCPVILAFKEHVPKESIARGIKKLAKEGANHILIIPLFIGPSLDIDEIDEILTEPAKNIGFNGMVKILEPLGTHPLLTQVILERAKELSKDPSQETLIFIHPGSSKYTEVCDIYAQSLRRQLKSISSFRDIRYGFLFQDFSGLVRKASSEGKVIVVPLLIGPSKYYGQIHIPRKLKGLRYAYSEKPLLPDARIARWIELTASKYVKRLTPILIYDQKDLIEISIEDVGKYHGDICPCMIAGFRATQLAISQLWKDEIPKRGDFRIISAYPGQGSQDAFEFITRAKTRKDFTLELPEGTDLENITMENWAFILIRKSTGEQIKIWVKEEVFPGGSEEFFDLRKKVKFERTATPEEKETLKSTNQELRKVLINLPVDKLFGFKRKRTEMAITNSKW